MTDTLATQASAQMVPGEFAEKAMASLMQMHSELMDEKERRVELYRKLMEREQTVAELRMYVKLLEEKMAAAEQKPQPQPEPKIEARDSALHTPVIPAPAIKAVAPTAYARAPEIAPPLPPRVARPKVEGWKTW